MVDAVRADLDGAGLDNGLALITTGQTYSTDDLQGQQDAFDASSAGAQLELDGKISTSIDVASNAMTYQTDPANPPSAQDLTDLATAFTAVRTESTRLHFAAPTQPVTAATVPPASGPINGTAESMSTSCSTAATSRVCDAPLAAGVKIGPASSQTAACSMIGPYAGNAECFFKTDFCTSGFVVNMQSPGTSVWSGGSYLLTAAHCIYRPDDSLPGCFFQNAWWWTMPSAASGWNMFSDGGAATQRPPGGCYPTIAGAIGCNILDQSVVLVRCLTGIDYAILPINGTTPSLTDPFATVPWASGQGAASQIDSSGSTVLVTKAPTRRFARGQVVCHIGAATGRSCGRIVGYRSQVMITRFVDSLNGKAYSAVLRRMWVVRGSCADKGDSGGPVFDRRSGAPAGIAISLMPKTLVPVATGSNSFGAAVRVPKATCTNANRDSPATGKGVGASTVWAFQTLTDIFRYATGTYRVAR
jgi:hypothetical protein